MMVIPAISVTVEYNTPKTQQGTIPEYREEAFRRRTGLARNDGMVHHSSMTQSWKAYRDSEEFESGN